MMFMFIVFIQLTEISMSQGFTCVDKNRKCASWARQGECKKGSRRYMEVNCKRSCKLCTYSDELARSINANNDDQCSRKCKSACPFGVRLIGGNCNICQCCDIPLCPRNCIHGKAYSKDRYGCTNCRCKNCPFPTCPVRCRYGTTREIINGCSQCKCRKCPVLSCPSLCEWGIETVKDSRACLQCKCLPQPQCWQQIECPQKCARGMMIVYDGRGCEKCVCDDQNCPSYICPTNCREGTTNVKDNDGCLRCDCEKPNGPGGKKKPHQSPKPDGPAAKKKKPKPKPYG